MNRKKIRILALCICMTAFPPALAVSEDAPPPAQKSRGGREAELRLVMKGLALDAVGLSAGLTLEGFLDLGIDLWSEPATAVGADALAVKTAVTFAFPVLAQDSRLPLSLVVRGSFAKAAVLSAALDAGRLLKQGIGYSLGAELSSSFTLSPQWSLRVGMHASYYSFSYTTEPAGGDQVPGYPLVEPSDTLLYGATAAVSFAPNKALTTFVGLRASLDQNLVPYYGPFVGVALASE